MGLVGRGKRFFARVSGVISVVIGQAAQSVTNFITGIALGRFASQEELGAFALGFSFCFFAISLGDNLVATPYTFFKSQNENKSNTLFGAALLGTLGVSVFISGVLWVCVLLDVASLSSLWLVLPLAVSSIILREFFRRHLYVAGKLAKVWFVDLFSAAIQLTLIFVLTASGSLTAGSAFVAITVAAGLPVAYLLVQSRGAFAGLGLRELWFWQKTFFEYGRWLVMGGACHVASVQLYPWLALLGGGERQVGAYAACTAVMNLINPMLIGLSNYFRPKFMSYYRADENKKFALYVAERSVLFLLPALVFCWIAIAWGEGLLEAAYGSGFRIGGDALAYMSLGTLAIALSAPFQLALLAARAPVTNLYYHGTTLLLSLILAGVLISHLSLNVLGAIYGGANFASLLVLLTLFFGLVRFR